MKSVSCKKGKTTSTIRILKKKKKLAPGSEWTRIFNVVHTTPLNIDEFNFKIYRSRRLTFDWPYLQKSKTDGKNSVMRSKTKSGNR